MKDILNKNKLKAPFLGVSTGKKAGKERVMFSPLNHQLMERKSELSKEEQKPIGTKS